MISTNETQEANNQTADWLEVDQMRTSKIQKSAKMVNSVEGTIGESRYINHDTNDEESFLSNNAKPPKDISLSLRIEQESIQMDLDPKMDVVKIDDVIPEDPEHN